MPAAGFLYALENIGGFGGVADRLNAYNIFLGDPALITTDLERFQEVTARGRPGRPPPVPRRPAEGHALGRRPEGRDRRSRRWTARCRLRAPGAGRVPRPAPEILRLSCGMPLWVLPRARPADRRHDGRHGRRRQPPAPVARGPGAAHRLDDGRGDDDPLGREIALAAEAMGTSLSTSCGWDGAFVCFRCLTPLLEPSLDLAVDVLRDPTFPEPEWERVHGQTLAAPPSRARQRRGAGLPRPAAAPLRPDDHPYRIPSTGRGDRRGPAATEAVDVPRRLPRPGPRLDRVAGDVDPEAIAAAARRAARRLGRALPMDLPAIPSPALRRSPRILLLDRPGRRPGGGPGRPRRDRPPRPRLRARHAGQPDPRRPVHVAAQRQAPRGEGVHLRRPQPFRLPPRPGPVLDLGLAPVGPARRGPRRPPPRGLALVGDRPPRQAELDDARRALIEGQARQFETPSALVNRYASLFIHGLPLDHYADLPRAARGDRPRRPDAAAHRQIHPNSLVAVVVADAARSPSRLKRWSGPSWS